MREWRPRPPLRLSGPFDLGFHIDPAMSLGELRKSTFSKAIEAVRAEGYVPIGSFRFCKFIRKGTGEVLTEEQAKDVPMYDLFYLYVDLMVDHIHPKHNDVFGMKPLDEPVLARTPEGRQGHQGCLRHLCHYLAFAGEV